MIKNYKLPASYHLGSGGCGCAMCPPNHPRYFVQPIYTRYGNSPSKGAQYYLRGMGFVSLEEVDKLFDTAPFPKLPLDHPRTRAWIIQLYKHFNHCYNADSRNASDCVIYPVPWHQLKSVPGNSDGKYSDQYMTSLKEEADRHNAQIEAEAKAIATPDNHLAVKYIRKYYPDYAPDLELIENPPTRHIGNWYSTGDRPSPTECRGQYGNAHPVNKTWCQWCGWYAEDDTQA